MVIDEIFEDPDAVSELARQAKYSISLTDYPGLHAKITDPEASQFFEGVSSLLKKSGHLPEDFELRRSDFSVVTVPEHKLRARQQHPHVDPVPYFGIIHLSVNSGSATAFYRNSVTGLSGIQSDEQEASHNAFLESYGKTRLAPDYNLSSNSLWELLGRVEARYNRLVFYPGYYFHAVEPGPIPVPFNLHKARITQRLMFG